MMRTLIVDDEPLARRRLELMLAELGHPRRAFACAQGVGDAIEQLSREHFDIVLLDIKMRDGTGFDVIRGLEPQVAPAIVFITAFEDYAVRAFEIAAADYLLKPVALERLRLAMERAVHVVTTQALDQRRAALARLLGLHRETLREAPPGDAEADFWIRRARGDFVRLAVADIDYAVVEEDYVRIFAGERSYLLRESVRGLRDRLDAREFVQVHRSAIVRASRLAEVTRARDGSVEVLLQGGQRLPVGRVHGKAIRRLIGGAAA